MVVWAIFGMSGLQRLKKAFTVEKMAQIWLKIASKTVSYGSDIYDIFDVRMSEWRLPLQ